MEKKLDGLVALLTGAQSISSNSNNSSSSANLSDQEQAAIGLANLAPSLSRLYGQNGDKSAISSLVNDTAMPDFNVGACLSALKAKDDECQLRRKERREAEEELERQQEKVRQDVNCSNFNFIMPPPPKVRLEDVIGRNLVSEAQAEEFFSLFAEMSTHFPFYVIPPGTTPASLRREKPVLLMAILCTASGIEKRVQMVLERDFRKVYSERIIVNGEKTLELLQAGLIYLAWFQCHFSPKTQIFLQMMHIFISLVTDLGYDRKPDKVKPPTGVVANDGSVSSPMFSEAGSEPADSPEKAAEKEFRSKEIRRAFLGCWWLTNSISIDFRKRIPLHFSSYMGRCQQTFVDNPEFESDKYMVMMLRLQKFQEDVCETFRYHEPEIAGKQDLLRIQMSLKAFQSQLKIIEQDFRYLDPRNPTYDGIYPAIFVMGIYLHEIGLHMTPPPASTASYAPTASLEYTAERISILSECLAYTKKFLDYMTTRDASCYRKMPAPCWMRISYALVVLSKLALGGTEPVDLCTIKEKTVIQYSNKQYTTLNPHPSVAAEVAQKEKQQLLRKIYDAHSGVPSRSPSPEAEPRPGIALIPSPSNVDGWDTSVVRAAVKMEIYLERMVEVCKILHRPSKPIREEDRERYKANGVEEIVPPDLYDFGMWMFGTMKEWYLAMVRREEEIEEAVRDAVSATPSNMAGNAINIGSSGGSTIGTAGSGTPGGSIISNGGTGSARTRSTSISVTTPGGTPLPKDFAPPSTTYQSLKRKFEGDKPRGMVNGGMGDYGSPAGGSGQGMQPMQQGMGGPDDGQMTLPPSIGFEIMDPVGDDFWGAMWSNWPLFYPGA